MRETLRVETEARCMFRDLDFLRHRYGPRYGTRGRCGGMCEDCLDVRQQCKKLSICPPSLTTLQRCAVRTVLYSLSHATAFSSFLFSNLNLPQAPSRPSGVRRHLVPSPLVRSPSSTPQSSSLNCTQPFGPLQGNRRRRSPTRLRPTVVQLPPHLHPAVTLPVLMKQQLHAVMLRCCHAA
jgi:hypothetical protein